jgi:hypothetical protein
MREVLQLLSHAHLYMSLDLSHPRVLDFRSIGFESELMLGPIYFNRKSVRFQIRLHITIEQIKIQNGLQDIFRRICINF